MCFHKKEVVEDLVTVFFRISSNLKLEKTYVKSFFSAKMSFTDLSFVHPSTVSNDRS